MLKNVLFVKIAERWGLSPRPPLASGDWGIIRQT